MNLPKSGLAGPFLAFANGVQAALNRLSSVPMSVFNTVSDLPNAVQWQGRSVLVRDLGAGSSGIVTALDGAWIDHTGATIA